MKIFLILSIFAVGVFGTEKCFIIIKNKTTGAPGPSPTPAPGPSPTPAPTPVPTTARPATTTSSAATAPPATAAPTTQAAMTTQAATTTAASAFCYKTLPIPGGTGELCIVKLVGVSQDQARQSCVAKGYAGLAPGPIDAATLSLMNLLKQAEPNFGPTTHSYLLDGQNETLCNSVRYDETSKEASSALVSCAGGSNIGFICISKPVEVTSATTTAAPNSGPTAAPEFCSANITAPSTSLCVVKLFGKSQADADASCKSKSFSGLAPQPDATTVGLMDYLPDINNKLGPQTTTYFLAGQSTSGMCNALRYDSTKTTGKVSLVQAACAGGSDIGYVCASSSA